MEELVRCALNMFFVSRTNNRFGTETCMYSMVAFRRRPSLLMMVHVEVRYTMNTYRHFIFVQFFG